MLTVGCPLGVYNDFVLRLQYSNSKATVQSSDYTSSMILLLILLSVCMYDVRMMTRCEH